MASSARYNKRITKIKLGDLDTQVNIYKRELNAPKNVKYNLNLKEMRKNVWVMWEVRDGGVEIFDEVNQSIGTATEIIRLHYDRDFRDFDYIEYNDNLYEVLSADWLDPKNREFIVLYCVHKGSKNKKVNIL